MRYDSQFKEQFSLAYIRAVAALAGCDVTRVEVDVNGCDISISATDDQLHPRLPKVDAQVKCTARESLKNGNVVFDLDAPTYRKLRQDTLTPRILIVVLVPPDPLHWIVQSEEKMTVHHCGYWRSLYDLSDTSNSDSVRVRLPRAQMFTAKALQGIMETINRDGKL